MRNYYSKNKPRNQPQPHSNQTNDRFSPKHGADHLIEDKKHSSRFETQIEQPGSQLKKEPKATEIKRSESPVKVKRFVSQDPRPKRSTAIETD